MGASIDRSRVGFVIILFEPTGEDGSAFAIYGGEDLDAEPLFMGQAEDVPDALAKAAEQIMECYPLDGAA